MRCALPSVYPRIYTRGVIKYSHHFEGDIERNARLESTVPSFATIIRKRKESNEPKRLQITH